MTRASDPFSVYHRVNSWVTFAKRSAIAGASVAILLGLVGLVNAAPPAATTAIGVSASLPLPAPASVASATTSSIENVDLISPLNGSVDAAPPTPEPIDPDLAITGSWEITIDTRGYQAEIDKCLWVRMDLGAAAPIVGAHNYCGGGVVLRMAVGDTVTLRGAALDGTYTVTGERDANAGDLAADATAGITADVILQTCYWTNDGSERLVSLVRS